MKVSQMQESSHKPYGEYRCFTQAGGAVLLGVSSKLVNQHNVYQNKMSLRNIKTMSPVDWLSEAVVKGSLCFSLRSDGSTLRSVLVSTVQNLTTTSNEK